MVVEVVLGIFGTYHDVAGDTGGFLSMWSGNTNGIKMAMAKSGLFLSLCCGEK